MVVDSEITHVTRVHNLIEDVPPGIYDVDSLNSIQRMNVITRCLGQTTPAPPELLSWALPPGRRVQEGKASFVGEEAIRRPGDQE
jgi:hypothetical protein